MLAGGDTWPDRNDGRLYVLLPPDDDDSDDDAASVKSDCGEDQK